MADVIHAPERQEQLATLRMTYEEYPAWSGARNAEWQDPEMAAGAPSTADARRLLWR